MPSKKYQTCGVRRAHHEHVTDGAHPSNKYFKKSSINQGQQFKPDYRLEPD
jgi:hypothetical protein